MIEDYNEFLLQDRIQKIQQTISEYGEEKFYISFSGGKDSTVVSSLVDMAIPGNSIPRVYANTGIELNMIRSFVFELSKSDDRIHIIKPSVNIKQMLEIEGYPFKSKYHSQMWSIYNHDHSNSSALRYVNGDYGKGANICPEILMYQFTEEYSGVKISHKCCNRLKKEPICRWQREHNKPYAIIGVMPDEGGKRENSKCLVFFRKHLKSFQPLVAVTKSWEDWYIQTYNVKICDIYKPPYNALRTGCKGCPFNIHLQKDLDMLEKYFPEEKTQCEIIWKPVYEEYRRIGYRLREVRPEFVPSIDFGKFGIKSFSSWMNMMLEEDDDV